MPFSVKGRAGELFNKKPGPRTFLLNPVKVKKDKKGG